MLWVELSIQVPAELVEPIAEVFARYGKGALAIEEPGGFNPDEGESPPSGGLVILRAYLPVNRGTPRRRARIDVAVRLLSLIHPLPSLEERSLDDGEWERAWKSHFTVLHVGQRLVLCPRWMEYQAPPGELVVRLDPGLAFGTGHHPTTRMCLEALERLLTPGARVLDLGTGSGVLAITAALLGASQVAALDTDATAVRAARANARLNRVGRVVKVFRGTLPWESGESFNLVLANISARVISSQASLLVAALGTGGLLIASGMLQERRGEVETALAEAGARVIDRMEDGDWVALVAGRRER
ncbi:MAG: 50S ribosomal protein L11 methyltransferase [Chloroflexi bacterium]|nr:50S ribosomal protein L11 methyltransferase [Chloroflexota bacterium]